MLISEIARKAKVSPATVSRAINQPHIVAADSLARIRAVMEQHNYVPAPAARRRGPKARQAQVRRVGVWFVGARANNPSLNWFQDQMVQVQSENSRYRVDLSLLFTTTPDDLPRGFSDEKLDGVIIQGMEPSRAVLARLGDLPHVWFMTRRSTDYPGDYVEPNNVENGRLAAEYLHEKGHRTVAVLTTEPDYSASVRRIAAFQERAKELGLKVSTILGRATPGISYLEIAPMNEEVEALVKRLRAQKPHPTGVYLPVDHFAGAFFRALRRVAPTHGGEVETILGNYNPIIYHNLEQHPAVIDINLATLVRKVVDHLVWRIENPGSVGRIGVAVSPTLRPSQT
jgi:LacI family transcriptional regulator